MSENETPDAISTRTNSHYLMGNGTVCDPTKLPKGELFVSGPPFDKDGNRTGKRRPVCHRCNKVNTRRR